MNEVSLCINRNLKNATLGLDNIHAAMLKNMHPNAFTLVCIQRHLLARCLPSTLENRHHIPFLETKLRFLTHRLVPHCRIQCP